MQFYNKIQYLVDILCTTKARNVKYNNYNKIVSYNSDIENGRGTAVPMKFEGQVKGQLGRVKNTLLTFQMPRS